MQSRVTTKFFEYLGKYSFSNIKLWHGIILLLSINFFLNRVIGLLEMVVNLRIFTLFQAGPIRVLSLSFLLFYLLNSRGNFRYITKPNRLVIVSVYFLLFILAVSTLFLPNNYLRFRHLSASSRFVFFSLSLLCIASQRYLYINNKPIYSVLFLLFISLLIFYPYLILKTPVGIRYLLEHRYSKGVRLFNANEDANAMVTLFPLILAFLKTRKMRVLSIGFMSIVLIYNPTRSAKITYIIILLMYYHLVANRKIIYLLISLSTLLIVSPYLIKYFSTLFQGEAIFQNWHYLFERKYIEGNLGWRIQFIWIPAIDYTFHHSPLIGFGSYGWEYVARIQGIVFGTEAESPHNTYVWVYVSWGLLGLLWYITFLLILLKKAIKHQALSKSISQKKKSSALICSIIAYSIWSFISNSNIEAGWVVLFFLAILVMSQSRLIPKAKLDISSKVHTPFANRYRLVLKENL